MSNITLFGQIIQSLDRSIFNKIVKKHKTDKYQKGFNSWSHLISMLFSQFSKSQSLRDIRLHTLLDFDRNLLAYVNITDGKTADNKGAYDVPLLRHSVIVADRFYNDFALLNI
jgi:hypothetical protein